MWGPAPQPVVLAAPAVLARKWVGAHVSAAGGIERAVVNAAAIGARAFALDTRSKRRWETPPLDPARAEAFRAACAAFGFSPSQILPHGSYLVNLGSQDEDLLAKSYTAFVGELRRCEAMGIQLFNIHPGTTSGMCDPEVSMRGISAAINRALAETRGVCVVLENVAGQGSSVGHSFEQLKFMIELVDDKSRIGVCLDTCHLFAAGYDVSTRESYEQTIRSFDEVVGLHFLKGMHINDSKCALGSRKDRHENIGRGMIGIECFKHLMNDPRLDGIPLIVETPVACKGPALDYKRSLAAAAPVFKQAEADVGQSTQKHDVALLYSLVR
ncbi:hypothetical protein WJX81_007877 [Elliptochloris bilobata]|uniref:Xylose isomerase-like TIM barrel domain-containing protein n=1 Tax=Elliptochloris bilobata TaxID=381761 RepID=A0AAW1RID2_9CHLO